MNEKRDNANLWVFAAVIFIMLALCYLVSCNAFPQVADDMEKVLTNDCVVIKIDRDAFQKDTDVSVKVDVTNKDVPVIVPNE